MHRISEYSILLLTILVNTGISTPLDDYVNTPDPSYSWQRLQTYPQSTHTLFVLNMTSQKWFDESISSQSIWWHYLTITVPKNIIQGRNAFLMIGGGDNTDPVPTTDPMTTFANNVGSIAATLFQIPNQPIRFRADPLNKNRDEDAIIAWTWKEFIEGKGTNPKILLRFPMTKAVVRAMDTIQQFLRQQNLLTPDFFVIGGASKRGWTTWTTAAVDNARVIGAVPLVMDMLNLQPNMMSHYRSLAGWTFAFNDYYELNITLFLTSPYLDKLAQQVDPYSYLDRYSKTKILQIQGAGDEFFLPDSENFFWNDLQMATGGSYLRRIPNVGHNLRGYEETLASFYMSVVGDYVLPSLKWTRTNNGTHGTIRAVVDFSNGRPIPSIVSAYQATTSDNLRKDFRQAKLDLSTGNIVPNTARWSNVDVIYEEKNSTSATYSHTFPIRSDGKWVASFIQVTFPGRKGTNLILTTETLILPNTYPIEECYDTECYGNLV